MLSTRAEHADLPFILYSRFVKELFAAFEVLEMPVYLNPALAHLIKQPETHRPPRYVFVCNGVTPETLALYGFTAIGNRPRQYTKIIFGTPIELHITTPCENWMTNYLLSSQVFAHTAVLSDIAGHLYAPLPITRTSHHEKIIYALHDPAQLFNENIETLFDVVELSANRYRISDALLIAAEYWQPDSLATEKAAILALNQRIEKLKTNEGLYRSFLTCIARLENFFSPQPLISNASRFLYSPKIMPDENPPVTPELTQSISPLM